MWVFYDLSFGSNITVSRRLSDRHFNTIRRKFLLTLSFLKNIFLFFRTSCYVCFRPFFVIAVNHSYLIKRPFLITFFFLKKS